MRCILLMILALALVPLVGCTGVRMTVRDQGTGVAVMYARAVILESGVERSVADADDSGRLHFLLPRDPQAIVAIRAQGFLQWSKPVAWIIAQPQPLTIDLAPLWLDRFLETGLKPAQIVEPKGCNCHHQR